jgi:dipeptidyl-peptidase-4
MPAAAAELTLARLFDDPPLTGPTPRTLKLAPDGSRVTFLRGRADDQNRLDLWEYRIAARSERLLVDSMLLSAGAEQLSDEEKARRERLRIAAFSGIVDYQFAPDGRAILFPLAGELYRYDLGKRGAAALRQLTRAQDGFVTDPKVSPGGRYVSFVRARRLFALDLERGLEFALSPAPESDTVAYASAEFVAQEEMDRLTGYWWAPDDSAIAYTRIDEAPVPIERRFEIYADRTEVIEQRYPAAGKPNVQIALATVALDPDRIEALDEPDAIGIRRARVELVPVAVDLGPDPDIYLARVNWFDRDRVLFQRQSRDQRRLDLILHDRRDRSQRTLLSETSATWVNLSDDLRVLREREQLLWSSERSGLRQLYLYGLDGSLIRQVSHTPWALENVLALDRRRGIVYAHAPGPDALEKHVYAYRLDGEGEPERITREPGWHEAVFSGDTRYFVATHSDPATPPRVRLFEASGRPLGVLEANAVVEGHPYHAHIGAHVLPEFGTLAAADGQRLHYALFKPRGFDTARRYPAIVRYYGGPGRQFVRRDFTTAVNTGVTDLLTQYWLARGYVVFALDNRGTPRRGKAFEDPLHRRMGEVEIEDQRRGIAWLAAQPFVDRERIGSFGWSYGGYIALLLAAKAGDLVAANAAVAPVTDWALYDTHYTERYMDHPHANVAGYAAGNVLKLADRIGGDLLIVHGMADDNVLFTHSTALMALLQARAFRFELMTYPGGKHGLVGARIRTHVYEAIDDFFRRHLAPAGAAAATADPAP